MLLEINVKKYFFYSSLLTRVCVCVCVCMKKKKKNIFMLATKLLKL